eukprot:CAMPEP_0174918732 /NCGR_PEP_ID=MMETSP1355-20121228/3253_1 /TAXON_ID=464990 /ORGANISM="Hemiselmis tepida, Strain CCMP443" /LENGTH=246 /DNA_ID=CAMNT_0016163921 /DNA_START=97 /DNA_END=833 /DNA_ORIENTATION=+
MGRGPSANRRVSEQCREVPHHAIPRNLAPPRHLEFRGPAACQPLQAPLPPLEVPQPAGVCEREAESTDGPIKTDNPRSGTPCIVEGLKGNYGIARRPQTDVPHHVLAGLAAPLPHLQLPHVERLALLPNPHLRVKGLPHLLVPVRHRPDGPRIAHSRADELVLLPVLEPLGAPAHPRRRRCRLPHPHSPGPAQGSDASSRESPWRSARSSMLNTQLLQQRRAMQRQSRPPECAVSAGRCAEGRGGG